MMRVLTALSAILAIVTANVNRRILQSHPDHPNACYLNDERRAYPVGTTMNRLNSCAQVTCERVEDKYVVTLIGCALIQRPEPPCMIMEDKGVMYPYCCPRIECLRS